jgi:hypothetical protein
MAALDDDIYAAVVRWCERGDELAEAGDHRAAIKTYNEAWRLVPEPRTEWNASTWILAAIADAAWEDANHDRRP